MFEQKYHTLEDGDIIIAGCEIFTKGEWIVLSNTHEGVEFSSVLMYPVRQPLFSEHDEYLVYWSTFYESEGLYLDHNIRVMTRDEAKAYVKDRKEKYNKNYPSEYYIVPAIKLDATQVKEGEYWYEMPAWNEAVLVDVNKDNDVLYVRFRDDTNPSRLIDIPLAATFTHV